MFSSLPGLAIAGLATCVPSRVVTNEDLAVEFGEKAMARFGKATGILARHVSGGESSLDLSLRAAELLFDAGHDRAAIDGVIFVSQTGEFRLPASAAIAQHKLGLKTDIVAFDVGLGCSGFVYGLMAAAQFLQGRSGRFLLLVGDTISLLCDKRDRATYPIFGDAGSATIVESTAGDRGAQWHFAVGTDGAGAGAIVVPESGFAVDAFPGTAEAKAGSLYMDGGAVFGFATTRVPQLINEGLAELGWAADSVDTLVLHQANSLILLTIGRKVGTVSSALLNCLPEFGNTSCASIPLAMSQAGTNDFGKSVLCGFGVGLSWAALFADLGTIPTYHTEF